MQILGQKNSATADHQFRTSSSHATRDLPQGGKPELPADTDGEVFHSDYEYEYDTDSPEMEFSMNFPGRNAATCRRVR
jgi:hypothetical protein